MEMAPSEVPRQRDVLRPSFHGDGYLREPGSGWSLRNCLACRPRTNLVVEMFRHLAAGNIKPLEGAFSPRRGWERATGLQRALLAVWACTLQDWLPDRERISVGFRCKPDWSFRGHSDYAGCLNVRSPSALCFSLTARGIGMRPRPPHMFFHGPGREGMESSFCLFE